MAFDIDTAKQVGSACAAAMGLMVGVIYKGTLRRFKKVEIDVASKADATELNRQRGHIEELYRDQKVLGTTMGNGFIKIGEDMHAMHLDIIDRIERAFPR